MEIIRTNLENQPSSDFAGQHVHRDQAAVLVGIRKGETPKLILTERSSQLGSHGGEVAWPGGKYDGEDGTLSRTALRESEEEIGLDARSVEILGSIRPFVSKFGLLVTPYIGLVPEDTVLTANPDEIAAIFEVPLHWFKTDPRSSTDTISRHGETHQVPVYEYEGFRIWGLTSMILREFLVSCLEYDVS